MDVVHVLADHTVGGAERADAHLLDDRFPVVQVGVDEHRVSSTLSVELKGSKIEHDQAALGGLVELELGHLGPVLGAPEVDGFFDRFLRETTVVVLLD